MEIEEDCYRPASIYRAARSIKREENTLYNALRSIYEDSVFVAEIAGLWPSLPLLANLRCGRWYSKKFDGMCYFKSTDGHTNNWDFSTARLNLHVAQLAGQKGGCIIVDSTRKGKRFPDSMSKTIPIWICVLNRAMERQRRRISMESATCAQSDEFVISELKQVSITEWDTSLHLPIWVPNNEKSAIENHIKEWIKNFESCGADISSLASLLRKPLRPLWISQKTLIWLNEVPNYDSWNFTPIILVSASATNSVSQHRTSLAFGWHYIPGAGDDEESWARGLSPELFWKYVFDIIDGGPQLCNKKVAQIVESERVYRAHRGQVSPQFTIKKKPSGDDCKASVETVDVYYARLRSGVPLESIEPKEDSSIYWIGSTNIAITASSNVPHVLSDVDCILDCDGESNAFSQKPGNYLHLNLMSSKFDRFSLLRNLSAMADFAKLTLSRGKKLLVCCHDGEDLSVCTSLAIFTTLFDENGVFDGGNFFSRSSISKFDLRKRLVYLCKYAINARPSRGNLKQVFAFVSKKGDSMSVAEPDDN